MSSSSSSSFLPCLVAYAQKASGGNKEKGAAGTGAGEAVAHIELAAVTLMSKVIRRGFFHLLFSLISISHSSLSSVSLLLLLFLPIFFINTFPNCSHPTFFFLTFGFAAHKYPRTAGSFNAEPMKHLQEFLATKIPPPPVIPVACSFQGPTTTRLALARPLFSPALESVNPPWAAAAIVCANTQTKYSRSSYQKKQKKKKKVRRQKILSACRETIRQREKKKHRFFHFFVVVGWDGTWTNGTE